VNHQENHVATGWIADRSLRWIEVSELRLEEVEKEGAVAVIRGGVQTQLSATELVALARHLNDWLIDDPAAAIKRIEAAVAHVKTALEAWDDRARADEEHPPYAALVSILDEVIGTCQRFSEEGPFAERAEEASK
jgi:hypothetical protein